MKPHLPRCKYLEISVTHYNQRPQNQSKGTVQQMQVRDVFTLCRWQQSQPSRLLYVPALRCVVVVLASSYPENTWVATPLFSCPTNSCMYLHCIAWLWPWRRHTLKNRGDACALAWRHGVSQLVVQMCCLAWSLQCVTHHVWEGSEKSHTWDRESAVSAVHWG